jgi:hypothetical protein
LPAIPPCCSFTAAGGVRRNRPSFAGYARIICVCVDAPERPPATHTPITATTATIGTAAI